MRIRGIVCALLAGAAGLAFAQQKVNIEKGAARVFDPGFQVEQFKIVGPKDRVTVVLNGGVANVTGMSEGDCTVQLLGPDGMTESYAVTVGNDVVRVKRNLEKHLELMGAGGLEVTRVDDTLVINGIVTDPKAWLKMRRFLDGSEIWKNVINNAEFRVQADTLKRFYALIKAKGFELTDKPEEAVGNKLFISYDQNIITISGSVYNQGTVDELGRIVIGQKSWLRSDLVPETAVQTPKEVVDKAPDAHTHGAAPRTADDEDWKPYCNLNLSIDQRLLHMDVVLVGYKETDNKEYGTKGGPEISATFSSFWDLIKGRAKNDAFTINANLNSVLRFMKEREISRHSTGGYIRFKCNDAEPANLHIGGTMKVKMRSSTAEGAPTENFDDITYGFDIDKKAANLISPDTVFAQLHISQKTPRPLAEGGYEEGYEILSNEYNPAINCPLGKTVVVAGYRSMVESTAPPSGFPVLRNLPLLNWFVSHEGNSYEDIKLMMLISVREVRPDEPEQQDAALPYEVSKNLTTDVQIPNQKRLDDEKKFHGFWSWLNWFMP